jgi:hypothetical protein
MSIVPWEIVFHPEFEVEFDALVEDVQDAILAALAPLEEFGPNLGRPRADTLGESRHANMKELRIQHGGRPWRVFFAFDQDRRAVLLAGGDKTGNGRFYQEMIPIADKRFDQWQQDR